MEQYLNIFVTNIDKYKNPNVKGIFISKKLNNLKM